MFFANLPPLFAIFIQCVQPFLLKSYGFIGCFHRSHLLFDNFSFTSSMFAVIFIVPVSSSTGSLSKFPVCTLLYTMCYPESKITSFLSSHQSRGQHLNLAPCCQTKLFSGLLYHYLTSQCKFCFTINNLNNALFTDNHVRQAFVCEEKT